VIIDETVDPTQSCSPTSPAERSTTAVAIVSATSQEPMLGVIRAALAAVARHGPYAGWVVPSGAAHASAARKLPEPPQHPAV
jgi:hypothetical protein